MKKLGCTACVVVVLAVLVDVSSDLFFAHDLEVLQDMSGTLVRMWFHSSDARVQTESCDHIKRRSFADLTFARDTLRRFGAVHLVVRALRRFPSEFAVQQECLNALQGLAIYNVEGGAAVTEAGGVELAITAMRNFPNEPSIAAKGSFIGCFCDFSIQCKQRFRECGGIEVLLEAVRRHERLGWSDEDMFQLWCGFAAGLPEPENVVRFVQEDGIELGVKVMKAHRKSPRVREEVLGAFFQPAAQSAEGRERIVSSGGLDELVRAMREEPHDDHVQNNAAFVVHHLAINSAKHEQLLEEAGVVKLLVTALHEYTKQRSVSHHAGLVGESLVKEKFWPLYPTVCRALVPFTRSPNGSAAMLEAGIFKEIADVVSFGSLHDRNIACELLQSIGRSEVPRDLLDECQRSR